MKCLNLIEEDLQNKNLKKSVIWLSSVNLYDIVKCIVFFFFNFLNTHDIVSVTHFYSWNHLFYKEWQYLMNVLMLQNT